MSVKNEQYLEESAKTLFCRNAFFIFMEKKNRQIKIPLVFLGKKGLSLSRYCIEGERRKREN